jgi:hypothetical protein
MDVPGEEEDARVLHPTAVGDIKAAQEVGHAGRSDVDAHRLREGANTGLGDVVDVEAFDGPLLEGQRLVLGEHDVQLVVVHLLGAAVEPPKYGFSTPSGTTMARISPSCAILLHQRKGSSRLGCFVVKLEDRRC